MATPSDAEQQAAAARRAAAFEHIRQWGDPVLRSSTSEVTAFDDALVRQAAEMVTIMDAARGAGLAAPQVGIPMRLLVYRAPDDPEGGPARALVNARVTDHSTETAVDLEGCLSLGKAQIAVEVERPVSVTVTGQELDGSTVTVQAEGRHARILQHEIDHLDGVLMLERAPREQRREAVKALREGRPWAPPQPEADGDAADAVEA